MKFIDLFAGIGGFRLGMEMAGHECVGHVEIDKYANYSYTAMHLLEDEEKKELLEINNYRKAQKWIQPKIKNRGEYYANDIRRIEPRELPEADIWCGGFPCQAFSIAGARRGFEDMRGTLVFEIFRLAAERKPKIIFLENVAGLLNHDGGRTFATILHGFWELGYDVEWQLLNSKDFGVPHNRERVFIVGYLRGTSRRELFPIVRTTENIIKKVGDLKIPGRHESTCRVYSTEGIAPTQNTCGGGGLETKIEVSLLNGTKEGNIYCLDANYSKGETRLEKGKRSMVSVQAVIDVNREKKTMNGRRIKEKDEPMFTLTSQDRHGVMINKTRIRKLTPKECFRLQGFPDEYFDRARVVNSDSQLYKQAGNGVTVNVIYEIGRRLIK